MSNIFNDRPEQGELALDLGRSYAVVDVETTGGRSVDHRVTEIGVVKVVDDKIVDEFQTLINPQRNIPANITRFTGISNAMVADAPLFSDVADEFVKFCEHSIFTAHYVQFDYGFIQSEFKRLGKTFRAKRFCTCAMARKYLKGPKRFGLGPLTKYYDIELKNHHRALDDAKAAAHLLVLINNRRKALV